MGWMVIVGSIPIGIIGYAFEDAIRGALRNLWITAAMLILFSFVFIAAEKMGKKERSFDQLTMKDAIIMGLCQCLALIPGVSRSGGTISGGLFLGLDREVATRSLKVDHGAFRIRLGRGGRWGGIALDRGLWIGAHAHFGLAGGQRGGAKRQQTGKDKCGARLRFHGY